MAELKIRMKGALRSAIEEAAKSADVSMNSEMVRRLEQSFRDDRISSQLYEILSKLPKRYSGLILNGPDKGRHLEADSTAVVVPVSSTEPGGGFGARTYYWWYGVKGWSETPTRL